MSSLKEQDQSRLSTRTLLDIIALSTDALAIYTGDEIIIEFANDAMLNFWGKGREIIGLPLYTGVPELQGQPFEMMLQEVLRTGITNAGIRIAETRIAGTLQQHYYEYEYRAIRDEYGLPYAILHRAANVTERELHKISLQDKESEVQSLNEQLATSNEELRIINEELATINRELQTSNVDIRRLNKDLREYTGDLVEMYERLAESEGRFRELVRQAPVASFILKGENMIIEMANNMMLEMIGKNASIVGKSLTGALPEIKGQPIEDLLKKVYISGETLYGNELAAYLEHGGELVKGYYKFIYQPLKNPEGVTHSIICIVLDITEQVTARKMAEQAEERLQLAVEATELGIWSVDWKTRKLNISERSRSINGIAADREITLEESFELIDPEHRDHIIRQLHAAVDSKTSFNAEHLLHPMDGSSPKWLRSTGKATYNEAGDEKTISSAW